jgi:hypothetical protein
MKTIKTFEEDVEEKPAAPAKKVAKKAPVEEETTEKEAPAAPKK